MNGYNEIQKPPIRYGVIDHQELQRLCGISDPQKFKEQYKQWVDVALTGGSVRVGCIDTKGDIVIPVEFDQLWEFEKNNLTTAQKDGKWLIIDRKGRTVQEVLYPEAFELGRLRSGLASIETHNGDGYINEHGSLHIPIKYDSGWEFRGELAMVNFGNFDGYINRQGIMVWKTDRWDGQE